MYKIPAKQHRHETIIKRSRFITTIAHASSADEANAFIASIKKEFPDASHNCWAYVAGPAADSAKIGMSDDGEPHGTAGKPMLNVLLHSDIGEIVAVVTRYFGGTKLGPGGLVKAYSGSV
ncbi:MAG: YigZ family protein, partial [Cocleimonas sp.]